MYQMSPGKITTRATNCVHFHILSCLLGHAVPLQSPPVAQQEEPPFPQTLTYIGDVQREPEQECVTDQLGKEQAQRKLDHTLKEGAIVNAVWD